MVKYSLYKVSAHSTPPMKGGGMLMTTYETISLMIAFGMLIAVLSKKEK